MIECTVSCITLSNKVKYHLGLFHKYPIYLNSTLEMKADFILTDDLVEFQSLSFISQTF